MVHRAAGRSRSIAVGFFITEFAPPLVADLLDLFRTVRVGSLAERKLAPLVLPAFAAGHRERDHDAVTYRELRVASAGLDDLAHGFTAHDGAGMHARHETQASFWGPASS